MTLPSEGINPWRTIPAQGGSIDTPNRIPREKLLETDRKSALDGVDAANDEFKPFGDDGFTFRDFIDIINPLQHIPIISTAYRNMTEDHLDPMPRVLGGTLFMGPIGLVSSIANVVVEHNTGKDLGQHVVAYFNDDAAPLDAAGKTAEAPPAAAGTDGVDPVTAWAQEQNAFYQKAAGAPAGSDGTSVAAWAQAQNEFYRTGRSPAQPQTASNVYDVAAWAAAQQAYYRQAPQSPTATTVAAAPSRATLPHTQTAARTDDSNPVTAWARAQTAAYSAPQQQAGQTIELADNRSGPIAAGADGVDPVTAWARAQTTAYGAPQQQAGQSIELADNRSDRIAAGADDVDPVTAWARAQTAAYGAPQQQAGQTIELAEKHAAPVAAGTDGVDPVVAWAQAQLAWVHGDRAREAAATVNSAASRHGMASQTGIDAGKADRFQEKMNAGWTKYHAAQQLSAPGHRPDPAGRESHR